MPVRITNVENVSLRLPRRAAIELRQRAEADSRSVSSLARKFVLDGLRRMENNVEQRA